MRYDARTRLQQGPIGSVVAQWSNPSFIKSIQTGTIELNGLTTATGTIAAVNMNNALLLWGGVANASVAEQANQVGIRLTLTNATTVTATRIATEAVGCLVRYLVMELNPGIIKQIQRFPGVDINGGVAVTQALTTVNTRKSFPLHLGTTYNSANDSVAALLQVAVTITSATVATLTIGSNPGAACLTSFDVIELF